MALRGITTQRRRLADEVYDQLVIAIMNREIGPDDRLVQEKLAAELEISRTPFARRCCVWKKKACCI